MQLLRAAIDTAIFYPKDLAVVNKAVGLALRHPRAMRSQHIIYNLGQRRMEWLNDHGIFPVMEGTTIAGLDAIKATISPDLVKGKKP